MKDIRESIHKDCYTEFCECFSAAWEEGEGSEVDGKE
jgi:queuine/archaeosine tRNA-ribosyltransferase